MIPDYKILVGLDCNFCDERLSDRKCFKKHLLSFHNLKPSHSGVEDSPLSDFYSPVYGVVEDGVIVELLKVKR